MDSILGGKQKNKISIIMRKATASLLIVAFHAMSMLGIPRIHIADDMKNSHIAFESSLHAQPAPKPVKQPAKPQQTPKPPAVVNSPVPVLKKVMLDSQAGGIIEADGLKLQIEGGSVDEGTEISLSLLDQDQIPKLDEGMLNITSNQKGYRFGPHGIKFKKKATLEIPYDPALLPEGIDAKEIHTYTFDENIGRWVKVHRVSVDEVRKVIVSETDHFSNYINSTITVPEHQRIMSVRLS